MNKNLILLLCLGWSFDNSTADEAPDYSGDWIVAEEILKRIVAPTFPDKDFDIREYGAASGGELMNTSAIAKAIAACSEAGGGRVVVPSGTWLTGPIHLKSNVNLHVSEGATLLFSTNYDDYLPAVYTRWEGVECYNYSPFVYAFEQNNIALTGKGTLDGQASQDIWWPWKGESSHTTYTKGDNQDFARTRLFDMGMAGTPVEERLFGDGDHLRPNFIQLYKCKNILIEGVTIKNSPMWEIHPVLSQNITVRGISVYSHGPNNDGCNPESCKDVLIEDCLFDVGDDCIAIKSGRNNDGRRINVPSENIIVRNCLMKDGHGGVVIGSEISGGCRNVFVDNCKMDSPQLDRALRIKTNSVRGGLIENIYFRNVEVGEVGDAVLKINFIYGEGDVGDFTPVVRNIFMENVTSRKSPHAIFIQGYSRSPIKNIFISNCQFEGVTKPNTLLGVENLVFDNVNQNTGVVRDKWGYELESPVDR